MNHLACFALALATLTIVGCAGTYDEKEESSKSTSNSLEKKGESTEPSAPGSGTSTSPGSGTSTSPGSGTSTSPGSGTSASPVMNDGGQHIEICEPSRCTSRSTDDGVCEDGSKPTTLCFDKGDGCRWTSFCGA